MIAVRPATPDDIEALPDADPRHYPDQRWREMLRLWPADHLAEHTRVLLDEQGPYALYGVSPLWPGVGELWWVLAPRAYQHRTLLVWIALRLIEEATALLDAHRLHVTVDANDQAQIEMLLSLGFRFQGAQEHYYRPGDTYNVYALFPKELRS